jgi:hypothetical protein
MVVSEEDMNLFYRATVVVDHDLNKQLKLPAYSALN